MIDREVKIDELEDLVDTDVELSGRDCPIHDRSMYRRECTECGGEGSSHHDCGEDTCCCADAYDNVICSECKGKGYFEWCHYCEEEKQNSDGGGQ
jgi:hypothetical protein